MKSNEISKHNTKIIRTTFIKLTPKVLTDLAEITPNFESEKNLRKLKQTKEEMDKKSSEESREVSQNFRSPHEIIQKNESNSFQKVNSINQSPLEIKTTSYKTKSATSKLKKSDNWNKKTQDIKKFQEYKNKVQSEKQLKLNIFHYTLMRLKSGFPFLKKKLNEEEEIFLQSSKIFEENMDCVEILKKVHEIEKMKQILFNEKQQKLFEFISKPLIYINAGKKKNHFGIELKSPMNNEKDSLKNILNYYENLSNEGKLTEIDNRLLKNIDDDVEEFLIS